MIPRMSLQKALQFSFAFWASDLNWRLFEVDGEGKSEKVVEPMIKEKGNLILKRTKHREKFRSMSCTTEKEPIVDWL